MLSSKRLKEVKIYKPLPKFPPISVTGCACALNCAHCSRHYLAHMINPARFGGLEALIEYLVSHQRINGVLISGGLNKDLKVPIKWEEVRRIKEKYDIKINVHVGIITEEDVEKIASSDVDVVSLDFVFSDDVIRNVYGIQNKTRMDYLRMLDLLEDHGVRYAPHLTVGINWGRVSWEYEAINTLKDRKFDVLVLNVLIPTKGTPMENVKLDDTAVKKVFTYARNVLTNKELSLGCMRPRGNQYEKLAVELGFERIVLPHKEIIKTIKDLGMCIIERETCCVFR
ncbi:MAG: radical SAM protein [Euryarchaeota archaeon]|nr:radical SAM protein [Euryarchaeota archaeon]